MEIQLQNTKNIDFFSDELPTILAGENTIDAMDCWIAWHWVTTRSATQVNEFLFKRPQPYKSVMEVKINRVMAWLLFNHYSYFAIDNHLKKLPMGQRLSLKNAMREVWPLLPTQTKQAFNAHKTSA